MFNRLDSARDQFLGNWLKQAPSSKARWNELPFMGTLEPKTKDATFFFSPDELNEHFSAIFNRHPPITDLQQISQDPTFQSPSHLQFTFRLASSIEQLNTVLSEFFYKSNGADGISLSLIRLCFAIIAQPLLDLINLSL